MTNDRSSGVRQRSFRANVVQTTATNLVIAGANVATGLLAARLLGPEGRGELAAIFGWPLLLAAVATLGLPEAIVYFSARAPKSAGAHFTTALVLALLASAVLTPIGWVLMPHVLAAQGPNVVHAARWFLLSIPLAATLGIADRPLRGIGDFRSWNLMRTAPTVAWLAILAVAFARGGAEPAALAVAFVLARLALVGPILAFVHRRIEGRWRADRGLVRPLLGYGLPSLVTVLPILLNQRLDQLLMAGFLAPEILGLYVVAVAWSGMLAPALLAFASVLFPRVASEGQTDADRAEVFARGLRIAVLVSVVLGVGAAAVTPVGLPLIFGDDFRAAVPAALVLVLAAAIAGVNLVAEEGLRGLGRPGLVLRAEAGGLVVTLVALLLLVERYELTGAAVASVAGYLTISVLLALGGRAATGWRIRHLLVPGADDVRSLWNQIPRRRVRSSPT